MSDLDTERLLFAWFAAIKVDDPDGDLHHAGCLPPKGDCPVAMELAEFVPKVAAEYERLSTEAAERVREVMG